MIDFLEAVFLALILWFGFFQIENSIYSEATLHTLRGNLQAKIFMERLFIKKMLFPFKWEDFELVVWHRSMPKA